MVMFGEMLSILREAFEDQFKPITPEEVKDRKKEAFFRRLEKAGCYKNSDGTYSCSKDVNLNYLNLDKFFVKFKKIGGSFYCSNNQLTSLKGAPEKVGGDFYCDNN